MTQRLMFLACVVDDKLFGNLNGEPVDKDQFVEFAAMQLGEEGCSDFIAWDNVNDLIRDNQERGPITLSYLLGE